MASAPQSTPAAPSIEIPSEQDPCLRVIPVLSCVLQQISQRNDSLPISNNFVAVFHALKPPTISIRSYLDRIVKYAYCSPQCFILALIYLDRIIQRNESFYITSLNVHRLLITSVMVAAKFIDDAYFNNSYYARVGGISTSELNTLELEFLYLINFSLHVQPEVFDRYLQELQVHASQVHPSRPCFCLQTAQSAIAPSSASSSSSSSPVPSPSASSASISIPSSSIAPQYSASAAASSSSGDVVAIPQHHQPQSQFHPVSGMPMPHPSISSRMPGIDPAGPFSQPMVFSQ